MDILKYLEIAVKSKFTFQHCSFVIDVYLIMKIREVQQFFKNSFTRLMKTLFMVFPIRVWWDR